MKPSNMMIKAVKATLEMWETLDEYHKGRDYEKAVENLKKMLEENL